MLEVAKHHGFHFDSVQMPINILDAHFRSFAQLVAPEALRQNIAILGMKCFGSGVFLKSDLLKNRVVTPIECLHYSLSLPISVQITGINSRELLDQAFSAVQSFQPLDNTALAALLAKSQEAADRGKYELFKTTAHFDTTARHPDWLGSDSKPVQQLAPQLPG
jgi:hypothetical protein